MKQELRPYHFYFPLFFLALLLIACGSKKTEHPLFEVLDDARTGLHFTNKLTPTPQFNAFHYMYFYNGAGIGAGDFNNDGLIDLFFAANQGKNKLFLNEGQLHFKEVTQQAHIPQDGGWSTGVSVVDINNDGLLDIYVCKVGNYEILQGRNQLLICQGIDKNGTPYYADKALEYGVDFSGFSTQAAFLDYDMDGDLDLFLLNHSVHQNGSFAERKSFMGTYHPLSGDRIYRNDGGHFVDVTRATGINSSAISYGLGIAVSDIDLDGYPDIYAGNDFHENDYLYLNQHNGTFKEDLTQCMMHTSKFTMGVDVADINNDAYPEIISLDMLPSDPTILKQSLGDDAYDIFNLRIASGYNYQYAWNNLQLNDKNGMFSEVGMYAGVAATDWSWAPLWVDFDNDGYKDLFISNGIPKRLNDMDFISYISNEEVQQKLHSTSMGDKEMALISKLPQIKLPNKFFKNAGNLSFQDVAQQIKDDKPTYSNGAVYADLDNDGDLDIVVNNIDDPVWVYENKSNDTQTEAYVQIKLKGPATNINAVGAKVVVFTRTGIRTYEKYPVKGFASSMEVPVQIGIQNTLVDSLLVIWPDNTFQSVNWKKGIKQLSLTYQKNLPPFDYNILKNNQPNTTKPVMNVTRKTGINFLHEENPFVEFDREPLIPRMVSREGPALAVGDANGDGLDDVFIGSSKQFKSALFLQQPSGRFLRSLQPSLDNDSTYEDVDACWVDVNNDNKIDLVVASGGNEYYGQDSIMMPRVYLGDGHAHFTKLPHAFKNVYVTASCVAPCDFNNDGYIDLFIGGRAVPWAYGQVPPSYLLQNNKDGTFKDVTVTYAKELPAVGFVKNALWLDIDKDGDEDLILALEWGGICAFINEKGTFKKQVLSDKKGWWNFLLPCDVDGDGDLDFIAGNQGLNSRLKATEKEPVKLYYNDFDGNGKKEQVLTYFVEGREIPFASKDELQKQMPVIKKRFYYAADFAKASLNEIFTSEKLKSAAVLSANYFANALLLNEGKGQFTIHALPPQAQFTLYNDAVVVNANNDTLPDILLAGNFYENTIQLGRYDADYGTLLINKGKGTFNCQNLNGLQIRGQVRRIRKLTISGKEAFIVARNNDSTMVIQFGDNHR